MQIVFPPFLCTRRRGRSSFATPQVFSVTRRALPPAAQIELPPETKSRNCSLTLIVILENAIIIEDNQNGEVDYDCPDHDYSHLINFLNKEI